MLISNTRIWVDWRASARSASSALPASEKAAPSRESARISRDPRRTPAWSSVIRMCIVTVGERSEVKGHTKRHGGTDARRTGNIQAASAYLRPFFHPQEAQRLRDFRFAKALAIVGHHQHKFPVLLAQSNADGRGFGVAHHVRQAFLEDAKEFRGLLALQREVGGRNRDNAFDSGAR